MKLALITLALLVLIAYPAYAQVSVNNAYTIPANFTANSDVLLVVETTEADYAAFNVISQEYLGSLQKVSLTKWVCYFAGEGSTCGSIPFKQGGSGVTYSLDITAFKGDSASQRYGVDFTPSNVEAVVVSGPGQTDNSLYLTVSAKSAVTSSAKYTIYNANTLDVYNGPIPMVADQFTGHYTLNETNIPAGSYYISFEFDTDKGAAGFTRLYTIGGQGSAGRLNVDPATDTATLNSGETYTKKFNIRNPTTQGFNNLTISLPSGINNTVKILLDSTSINAGSTIGYTLRIDALRKSLSIDSSFDIYSESGTRLLNNVPIKLDVSVSGQLSSGTEPLLLLSDQIWSGEYKISEDVSKQITVSNGGVGELEITKVEGSGIPNSAITFDPIGKLSGSDTAILTIHLKSDSAAEMKGKITVSSNGGSKDIIVNVDIFEDLEQIVTSLEAELASQKTELEKKYSKDVADSIAGDIELELTNANNFISNNDYSSAQTSIDKAKARLSMLSKLPAGGGAINPLLLVVPIIIIVLALVLYKMKDKFSRSPKKKEETDEFTDEEEY